MTINIDTLLYGRKPILELLGNAPQQIKRIIVRQHIKLPEALDKMLLQYLDNGGLIEHCSKDEWQQLLCRIFNEKPHPGNQYNSDADKTQGIIAELAAAKPETLDKLIASAKQNKGMILVLDQITDPFNLGSILRAAAAFGVSGVISTTRRSSSLTPVSRKAAMGAADFLPICWINNLHSTLKELRDNDIWLVGTSLTPESKFMADIKWPTPCALIIGSEGNGLRHLTLKSCDLLIKIPMSGTMQSLNVSQATAIMLYDFSLRRVPTTNALKV